MGQPFLMEGGNIMSFKGTQNIPKDRSSRATITPLNCKHPCPYGHGYTFCWPCKKDIIDDLRKKKSEKELKTSPAL